MTSLEDIKAAIQRLPETDKAVLASWFASVERRAWDNQITEDFARGGRGMELLKEVDAQIDEGRSTPLG